MRQLIGVIRNGKYYNVDDPELQERPAAPLTTLAISEKKPHVSSSAAVHPDQAAAFNKQCVRGVHYDNNGNLVSRSKHARQREARRRGLYFN